MWNKATTLAFLQFLTEELRARRKLFGLDATSKAMLIADDADQHRNEAITT
jgi:hypothetical protein